MSSAATKRRPAAMTVLTTVLTVLGEICDWLILLAILTLLAWAAGVGLTFMPAAGFIQNRGPLVTFEQGALAIGAGALIRWLLGGRALPSVLLCGLAAAAALCLLALVHTTDLYATREEVFLLVATSVLVAAAAVALGDATKTRAFAIGLALVTLAEAAAGLSQWVSGTPTPAYWLSRAFADVIHTRIYGTLGGPNILAGFLLLGIGLMTLLVVVLPGFWRAVPAAALAVEAIALLLTYSRGGYVGLAAFTVAAGVLLWPLRRRAWPAFAAIVAVAGAAATWLPTVALRAQSIAPTQEDTATSRLFIWHTAVRMADAHPLWGTGLGTFNAAYSPYRPGGVLATYALLAIPGSAHNDYLQLLVETGLVGVALLAGVLLWGLWRAIRRYAGGGPEARAWLGAWGAAGIGIGVTSLADENLFVVANLVLLLLFGTAACAASDRPRLRFGKRLLAVPLLAIFWGLPPLLVAPLAATTLHADATRAVKAGRYGEAVDTFQAALAADPLNGVVPVYYADLLADLYDRKITTSAGPWPTLRDRAGELYLRAEALTLWDAYPRAELGRLRRAEGRFGEAAASLRQAVALDPYTPRYRLWLGEVLLAAGDRAGAREQLDEAARLYPVELLLIEHHEGRSPRYDAAFAQMDQALALLKTLGGAKR